MRLQIIISTMLMFILVNSEASELPDSLILKAVLLEKQIMENDSDTLRVAQLLFAKSMLYKSAAQYDHALATLNRVYEEALPDSARCSVHFQKAFLSYMLRSFSVALQEIWSAEKCGLEAPEHQLLYMMILLENERWEDITTACVKQAKLTGGIDTVRIAQQFTAPVLHDISHYAKKARVPGLGLIKSGYIGKGITNIALELVFLSFAAYEFYSGFYFTGFFSGILPARRFYSGGKILTESLVKQKNDQQMEAFKQKGYVYIQNLYSFEK